MMTACFHIPSNWLPKARANMSVLLPALNGTTTRTVIDGESVNDLFAATIDATEEAVLNSLCMAAATTGRYGRVIEALPLDRVRELLAQTGLAESRA